MAAPRKKTPASPSDAPDVVSISEAELDALIERVREAQTHELALSPADYQLLLNVILTLASVQERLSETGQTIAKLRKLLGMVPSTEKLDALKRQGEAASGASGDAGASGAAEEGAAAADADDKPSTRGSADKERKSRRGGGKTKPPKPDPTIVHHKFEDMSRGETCPACLLGKVYKYEPAQFVRVTGHSPYSAERHVREQLRCNACGQIFTAPLPDAVQADGDVGQLYGHSARSLMAINKYIAGSPFHRQQSVQQLLGMSISASTIFDQCELVADDLNPVFNQLRRDAANATLYYIDDTTHRILQQKPVKKTRGGKTRLRTGVYASALLAIGESPPSSGDDPPDPPRRIVLYQTNVGHAGEWLDEILSLRQSGLAVPVVMSDALSSNQVSDVPVIVALCNAHGRRGFVELIEQYPDEIERALTLYQTAWRNDTVCWNADHSPEQRRDYHQTHSLPAMASIKRWCEEQMAGDNPPVEPNSNLGKAMAYFINHYEGLTRFCQTPGAPIDNNEIERLLKIIVRDRKNASFHQTAAGAAIANVLTSALVTCQENGVNAFDYLNAIQQNRSAVKANPALWMPWNYTANSSATEKATCTEQTLCHA